MMLGSKGLLTPLIPDCSALRALTILKNIRNPLIFMRKMASYSCFWRVPRLKIFMQASLHQISNLLTLVSCHFVKQVRTPPVRPADGAVVGVYESFVPGENLNRGSRRNQLRRGHVSPPVLSELPYELSTDAHSKECKRSPQQFIPAGFPLHDNLPTGTEDSDRLPHYTGHGPFRTRPPNLS